MPEVLEVEAYRRVAQSAVGRRVGSVSAPDPWYLKGGIGPGMLSDLLVGAVVRGARRRGKLLLLDAEPPAGAPVVVLGLRFGMTGRLLFLDPPGTPRDEVGTLLHGPRRDDLRWHRFALELTDGARLLVTDPRRLGGVLLDPSLERFGPEAGRIDASELAVALQGDAPLKAALMDQRRIAGLGNLLADEVLWRAGLAPVRPAGSLTAAEVDRLAAVIRRTVSLLGRRGGSHTGDLQRHRIRGGSCPRCGSALRRDRVGGRTTYWCPRDQR